jgi:hypothetical protein
MPQRDVGLDVSGKNGAQFDARKESVKAMKVLVVFPGFSEWHVHWRKLEELLQFLWIHHNGSNRKESVGSYELLPLPL